MGPIKSFISMLRLAIPILTLVVSGCGTVNRLSAPWNTVAIEGPLVGANGKAIFEQRDYWESIMAAGKSADSRFKAPDGRTQDANQIASKAVSFLARKGHLNEWPNTDAYIGSRVLKLAPYKIHIISILPTVVILIPHDYGAIHNRSNADLVGWPTKNTLQDDRILNYLYWGTIIPRTDQLLWFSPDLHIDIRTVPQSTDGVFVIETTKVSIKAKVIGEEIQFERAR